MKVEASNVMTEALDFLTQYGAAILFAVVFAEQIGLPLPAIPLRAPIAPRLQWVPAGVLVGTGAMNLWGALAIAVLAALAADWIWYELGRRRGRQVLSLLCRIALEPDSCVRRTEELFNKHGVRSLVLAKFIPGLSTIAPPLAGIVGLTVPLFLVYDGLGALLWAGSSLGIGYAFSDQIEHVFAYANHVTPAVLSAVAGALIGYISYKAVHRLRHLRQAPRFTVAQLKQRLETDDPPLLIDVRPRATATVERGLPGVLLIPLGELSHRHGELRRTRDLVFYCDCPADAASAQAALLIREKGFNGTWALAGGIEAWRKHERAAGDREHTGLRSVTA